MKKTISLVLVFTFIFVLALQLPVLADDNNDNEDKTITATSTEVETDNNNSDTSLEKIPSPTQINLYREIKKIGDDLFGIKKTEVNQEMNQKKLEKISSPALINLYREIKKIGDDLFGVKKASSTIANIQKNDDKKATEMKKEAEKKNAEVRNEIEKKVAEIKKSGMEKITSLDQVKLFDKITKVGNDLFGIKKKGVMILPAMNADLITCVSAAIDAKDTSISVSFTNASSETTSAIEARGTCQKSALALTSGRDDALKACSKSFQETTKTANEKAKKAQQEAWTVYKTSLKACSTTASTTEINIEDGGEILK